MKRYDFIVVGGGIVGICVARELKKRYIDNSIAILEKECNSIMHASGRNSGVLHAGFYYTADSLKAKLTADGNKQLTRYCEENKINLNKCGKLVVAKNEHELNTLDVLLERGKKNGVSLEKITEQEAKEIEPRVKTFRNAIFSPSTSSVNPVDVVESLRDKAISENIDIIYSARYIESNNNIVVTNKGKYEAGYIINSAGLYADKVAVDFGFSEDYRILPFKGLYLYSNEPEGAIRTNIYPVPDLKNPFLGVHFTITADKKIKIGPTAIPAFWREHYKGLTGFKLDEFMEIGLREFSLLFSPNMNFLGLAIDEFKKYSQTYLSKLSSALVTDVKPENYKVWGRPGIRAQLVNIRRKELEMDFVLQGDEKSFHILNAVSPGFTCCLSFASLVCDKVSEKLN